MRLHRLLLIALTALAATAPDARAQQVLPAARAANGLSAPRVLEAGPLVDALPVLDGRLDDPAWAEARVATDFVQMTPRSGSPATHRTEARVLVASDAIYVAMRMHDPAPDSIAAQLARRDASGIFSDWAHVVIDSYNDRRTGFRFSVSPRGIQKDVLHYNDVEEDLGWNAVWEVATRIDEEGWVAEFRIPLSQLRFSAAAGEEDRSWGINFGREVARLDERSYWAPVLQEVSGYVSQAGELRGIPPLPSPRRLEALPYSLARAARAPGEAADPFHRSTALFGAAGADLKYGVTSNLTLTATFNPDFGQVESDPSQVNLTAFETFFDERRPFFLEGSDIFRFRLNFGDGDGADEQLFYSRRIGRAPQGGLPDEAVYDDAPEAVTILGAAKLSGKTASGWSIGFLDAVTAPEAAPILDDLGQRREVAVEPLTNYAVARVMKDFRGGSSAVGGILTATHRRLDDDALSFLRSAAYSGAVDFRHRFGEGRYEVTGALLASRIEGSADAIARVQRAAGHYYQRPDADHLEYDSTRTSLTGAASMLSIGKINGNWRWMAGSTARSPGFEVNDLGYQRDADRVEQFLWVGYRKYQPGRVFRSWGVNFNQWTGWSFGGEGIGTGGNVNGNFQLLNYWGGYAGINRNFSTLSTGALRGGPAIVRPGRTNYWFGFYGDRRKPVGLDVDGWGDREAETGGSSFSLGPTLRVRPSSQLEFSLSPRMTWSDLAWQYVAQETVNDEREYLFARLEQTTASLTARLAYTFTPALSLELYAQPFLSAGDYSGFMEVAAPRAERFGDRFHRLGPGEIEEQRDAGGDRTYAVDRDGNGTADYTFTDPDFNFKQLRSNTVLRWEYRPGSTLYLVWSQGRSDSAPDGSFDLGRDGGRLFDAPGTNVLMLKASYWLDF